MTCRITRKVTTTSSRSPPSTAPPGSSRTTSPAKTSSRPVRSTRTARLSTSSTSAVRSGPRRSARRPRPGLPREMSSTSTSSLGSSPWKWCRWRRRRARTPSRTCTGVGCSSSSAERNPRRAKSQADAVARGATSSAAKTATTSPTYRLKATTCSTGRTLGGQRRRHSNLPEWQHGGMLDAITSVPSPVNEPVRSYAPGSPERSSLESRLKELGAERIDLPTTIDGKQALAAGDRIEVVQPHRHRAVLGVTAESPAGEWQAAVDAALRAAPAWRETSYDDRAAVLLRAADLLADPWRDTLNAATMLGQSKTAFQAEIDSACELIDFLRFNVAFGRQVLAEQPQSSPGVWNRMDHRPLEGFVLAITPFNFTAIAANLPIAPALMGNVVVWKPSPTQQLAAHFTMRLLEAAGLPPGVINMVTGDGQAVSQVALPHRDLAGIHFTGSTATFQHLWRTVGDNIAGYRGYPRLVGETGGKDFVIAHPSADVDALEIGLVRGAYEYQGQKCSAASRAYVPRSLWDNGLRDRLVARTESLVYGDVT